MDTDAPNSSPGPAPDGPDLLEVLLFDLQASSKMVRLAAIVQLARQAARPRIIEALQERLDEEDDEECRQSLQQVLRLGTFQLGRRASRPEGSKPSPGSAGTPPAPPPATPAASSVPGGAAGEGPAPARAAVPPTPAPPTTPGVTARPPAPAPAGTPLPKATAVASVSAAGGSGGPTPADLADAILTGPPESLPSLFERLDHSPPADRARTIVAILTAGPPVEILLPALDADEAVLRRPEVLTALTVLLDHPAPLVVLRVLHLLSAIAPARSLEHLPHLLLHSSLQVRVATIRLLYRLAPAEAIRLLDELLDSAEPEMVTTGLGLMFIFPFEEVSPILCRLIERQAIVPPAIPLVEGLVRSNPDSPFLARLVNMELRRPGEIPLAAKLVPLAAEALAISGLEAGTPAEIQTRFLDAERIRLARLVPRATSGPQGPASRPAAAPQAEGVASQAPTPNREGGAPAAGGFLRRCRNLPALNAQDQAELLSLLSTQKDPEDLLLAVNLVHKFRIRETSALKPLEPLLEHPDLPIRLAAMDALAELAPRLLTPHLPLLSFSDQPSVGTQAIRHLRRIEGASFLRRIQTWINDPNPRGREVALVGLMQLEFAAARTVVIGALRKSRDPSLIESLGVVLLMNPEARTITELQPLAGESTGRRKELLQNLMDQIRSNLRGLAGGTGGEPGSGLTAMARQAFQEMELGEKLNQILDKIRAIHYRAGGPEDEPLLSSATLLWLGAATAFLLSLWIGIGWVFPSAEGVETRKTDQTVTTRLGRVELPEEVSAGSRITGVILDYDPINKQWKMKNDQGNVFKLRTQGPAGLNPGDQVVVTAASTEKSPLGYTIVLPRFIDRAKP